MTRWFSAHRNKSERQRGLMTVEVDKVMTKSMALVSGSKINYKYFELEQSGSR